MNKELRLKIKEVTEKLIEEDRQKQKLLNSKLDYEFLQKLIDKSYENPDLLITIYLKSGDKITITQKYQAPEQTGFDGTPNEIEIR